MTGTDAATIGGRTPVRVMVIDDHEVVRDSFRDLFQRLPGYLLVSDFGDADLAEMFCARVHPDLVLLDICTEANASGLDAARRLRRRFPSLRIIVMTGFAEITYSHRARAAGANAFMRKSASLEEFERTITAVMAGEDVFDDPGAEPLPDVLAQLTPRELQIVHMLCRHQSRRDIAAELGVSEMTVKRHVANLLTKTGFADSVELAFHVITNGWIDPRF